MKIQRIVAAVAAASLAFSSAAFAQSLGASEQAMRENGIQNPNGPLKSPQQLRDEARAAQQQYHADTRGQSRTDQRDYRVDQRNYRGYDNRGYDNRGYDNRGYDNRVYGSRYDYRNYGYHDGGYRGHGRGAGPDHAWYRGDRLPTYYRGRYYVVDDWRGHHLYAPPQGYHWVQAGGDYVLVAIATGIIASILLNQ
jgi:Ni/Co efflux regulator RcnB